MILRYAALLTLFSINVTQALYFGRFCPSSCALTLAYVDFNDTAAWLSKKVRSCRSKLHTTSIYLCFEEYCGGDGEEEKWIADESLWCELHAGVKLPSYYEVVSQWSEDARNNLTRIDARLASTSPVVENVLLPDEAFINRAFTTMTVAFWEYDIHLVYGWCMYYFWSMVVLIGLGTRLLNRCIQLCLQTTLFKAGHTSKTSKSRIESCRATMRRYVHVPALFGERCSRPYGWCTIPPRAQSLTILTFVLLNGVLCSISYNLTDGNLYWPSKSTQLWRYVSDRTGIISLVNLPIVWLFGMRNNLLMWITGWGFGTYNSFHRWVARVATIQAVVHSIGYTVMIYENGGWNHFWSYWRKHYFWNGELATLAMCTILALSFYGLRRAHYEFFLVSHIVLSIITLWSMYYHLEIFVNGDWNPFIWPCLAIWMADRCARIIRILIFNRRFWNTKADISYLLESNLVRMKVSNSDNLRTIRPGTYYYVHVLSDMLHWHQNHPFTLAWVSTDSNTPVADSTCEIQEHPLLHRGSCASSESDSLLDPPKEKTQNLVFVIRPYDGFTSRLRARCRSKPSQVRVWIEGPYGHEVPLHKYAHVLFIVGGTGIAVPLSHISRLVAAHSDVRSLKIIWAVRESAFLASIAKEFADLLADDRVELQVHVTKDEPHKSRLPHRHLRLVAGRPDVPLLVEERATFAGTDALAVVACGPALMADQARKATVAMLAKGHHGVEYFEESFKW